ncbi:Fosfomycin resistance protein AbaF [Paraburkholderia hiiakae]|uniref:Fosfomycin resistance protein AbaF n=1 Tax=Paraburkholderia hiiakae TaxID=1081782 RepID=A0ABN7HS38_9BURK|nr:MFS transporter [Paraburkholderia hiiakae]CAD6533840.1 Fosfomycin resistance protein AbaF [Paraburkholderia hiiakae]
MYDKQKAKTAGKVAIGTATEWYDYFLYGTASALVFEKLFFPNFSQMAGSMAVFAVFGVTLIVRPLGAAIFGHFGDRLGRKSMLAVSILVMGIGTFLIGLLPTWRSIGVAAPITLVFLRLLQGFAVGGEYGGATTMAVEYAPENRRGLYAAIPQMGNPLGMLLGTTSLYLFAQLPQAQFLAWGWRLPFLLSAVMVAIGLYIRLNIAETPAFKRAHSAQHVSRAPLVTLWRNYRRTLLLVILAPAALNVGFYIYSTWSLSYLTHDVGVPIRVPLVAVMAAAALNVFAQPLFGLLSDRYGRKPVYAAGALWLGAVAYPFFWLLQTGSPALITLAMILAITIGHGATYSVQASFFSEAFDTTVRYSGLSVAYHLSAALFSGPATFLAAALVAWTHSTVAISASIVVSALVSLIAIAGLKETRHQPLPDSPEHAEPAAVAGTAEPEAQR